MNVQANSDPHLVWKRMGEARSMESTKISGSSSHAYTGVTCQYTDNTHVEPLVILNIDTKCHVIKISKVH